MTDYYRVGSIYDIDMNTWRWPNFTPEELASKGNGALVMSHRALDRLQELRNHLGVPLIVTSGHRDPAYNKKVGGATRSQHVLGHAFDIGVGNVEPHILIEAARKIGFTSFGTYPAQGFVHIDDRETNIASWGKPFPPRESRFAPEPIPTKKLDATKDSATAIASVVTGHAVVSEIISETGYLLPPNLLFYITAGLTFVSVGIILYRVLARRDASK
jgi:hypothetical protein